MTGSSSAIRKFVRVFAGVMGMTLLAIPLSATPIATGPDGLYTFAPGSLTYQLLMNNGGAAATSQGFVGYGNPATFTSTTNGTMTLTNLVTPGYTVDSATLDLTVLGTLNLGTFSYVGCTGGKGNDCTTYTHANPALTVGAGTQTTITVVSTSGTTYTWNYNVTSSSPFQLDLATADPDFLADLTNGAGLTIDWRQTIQLSGTYTSLPNLPPGRDKCRDCRLTFNYTGLSRDTVVQASVNGTLSAPPEPPTGVPEPSTGVLLGLGIIGTAATLRRRFFPR